MKIFLGIVVLVTMTFMGYLGGSQDGYLRGYQDALPDEIDGGQEANALIAVSTSRSPISHEIIQLVVDAKPVFPRLVRMAGRDFVVLRVATARDMDVSIGENFNGKYMVWEGQNAVTFVRFPQPLSTTR